MVKDPEANRGADVRLRPVNRETIMKFHAFAAVAAVAALWAGAASATITVSSIASAPGDAALGHGIANGAALGNGQIMIDNFGDNGGAQTPIAGFSFNPQVFDQDGGPFGYIRSGGGPPQLLGGESAPPPRFTTPTRMPSPTRRATITPSPATA